MMLREILDRLGEYVGDAPDDIAIERNDAEFRLLIAAVRDMLMDQQEQISSQQRTIDRLVGTPDHDEQRDRRDLAVLRRVREGRVCKTVTADYVIYNGKWYRDNAWNVPMSPPHLLTAEDYADNPLVDGDGFLPAWVEWDAEARADTEKGLGRAIPDGWEVTRAADIDIDYGRYWTAKPTAKQMEDVPW